MNNLDEMGDCSIKQEMNDRKIYVIAFLRREVREGRLRVIREEDRVHDVKGMKKRADVRSLTSFERLIGLCERENLVFDSLIYLEPVQIFKNRSNVMKFSCFGDNTSSRAKDKLKTIRLCSR